MGSTGYTLPSADSPDLALVIPTAAERVKCLMTNSIEWKGPLNPEQYIRRENHLMSQEMTKNGAMTYWILVDGTLPPDNRPILSSCESFGKRAFLAHNGEVEDILAHSIGSVFCPPEFRGRGYARRMIQELSRKLETWQQQREIRGRTVFSVLYSDIGKIFYAQHGWKPFPSSHMTLAPISKAEFSKGVPGLDMTQVKEMGAGDVNRLMCSEAAMQRYREILRKSSKVTQKAKVAFAPDFPHMTWHWAREEFYVQILLPGRGVPKLKGACVENRGVFCAWNRSFGRERKHNTLYILRSLFEESTSPPERQAVVEALTGILQFARLEAQEWDMDHVEIWNPTPLMKQAIRMLDPRAMVVDREKRSITSLRWSGGDLGLGGEVDWYWNERYAWC